jgi:hypothetical protein
MAGATVERLHLEYSQKVPGISHFFKGVILHGIFRRQELAASMTSFRSEFYHLGHYCHGEMSDLFRRF